ncbi:MAG: T9SS type A sorting domain-containing protein [Bacteroidia bacterium]|nr:T9SS type A sorting domain-containing protein [Bacteroidia bacterium]
MKNVFSLAGAPCAPAKSSSVAQIIAFAPAIKRSVFLFLAISLIRSISLAQSPDTLDVSEFAFQVWTRAGVLNAGDTATFFIELGTAAETADDVVGFEINLTPGSSAEFPEEPNFELENSWLCSPAQAVTQTTSDQEENSIKFNVHRNDWTGQTGYGELFRIDLVCTQDNTPAENLVAGGGGMVLIDNIGFKHLEMTPEKPLATLFPNPCSSTLHFSWGMDLPQRVDLVDMNGNSRPVSMNSIVSGNFEVAGMKEGIYQVVVQFERAREVHRLVIK